MMKHKQIHIFVINLLLATVFISNLAADVFFVSPSGSDAHPGSVDFPFASISHAASIMGPGDTCYIREGRYLEEIRLENKKASSSKPMVFRNYPNEEVVMDGTIPLEVKWEKYRGHIYKTRISKPVWQLFVNGRSMSPARWPNGNWDDGSIWDKSNSMAWPEEGMGAFGHHFNSELKSFDFSLEDGGIIIVNSGSFKTYKGFITSHEPGSDNFRYDTSRVRQHFSYVGKVHRHGYFLEGKPGLIDTEGEWFFEPEDSTLYLWSPGNTDPGELDIRGKIQSYAISGRNSSHIIFSGLDFFGTSVEFMGSSSITLEDCHFLYPSYSKRMLRDLSPMDVTRILVDNEFSPAHNIIYNCVFEYMDGPALQMNGMYNRMENCYIHNVDYSCTYEGGWTLNMINAPELLFRRNTIHTTGASETFKAGRKNLIELNNIYHTGYLQNDGAMVQVSVKQQDGSVTRYNWVHNSVKQGLRYDNSNLPNSPWGENGTLHHNVAWGTDRIFFKGDRHFIFNNLVFDSEQNDLIISSNTAINGFNYATVTRNNICNKFSGHRTKPGKDNPVPGIVDHNWAGNFKSKDIRTQLRDPDNLDFRPAKNSELVDGGALIEGKDLPCEGSMPDIGPYEFGADHYWIPGKIEQTASNPVPPNGSLTVKPDADLMWLEAMDAVSHRVYCSTQKMDLENETPPVKSFMGEYSGSNICTPPESFNKNVKYYWRVDAVVEGGMVVQGEIWQFTVGQSGK